MEDASLTFLVTTLIILLICSGFFSGSETAMMSLNRYRLRHLDRKGHPGARRASRLLERTDRLIGVILIGNNFVNILASAIATIIGMRLFGDAGIAIATGLLTVAVLVFSEVTPKTLAATRPEKIAFPATWILIPLLKLLYPLVWALNLVSNRILYMLGVRENTVQDEQLSPEELRTVVYEAGALIPQRRHGMLLNILDLDKVTVEDIMVPRSEVVGIDIDDDLSDIMDMLHTTQHTRLPVYRGDIQNVLGVLHMRNASRLFQVDDPSKGMILQIAREPYFVPESTPLNKQLFQFQKHKRRIGLCVDEYGDIQGIVTLEDILEEIVGEFTTDLASSNREIHPQEDGTYLIDGTALIRDINRNLKWDLPTEGPKTVNGVITEYLEHIPERPCCIRLQGYEMEIVQVQENRIRTVRVRAPEPEEEID